MSTAVDRSDIEAAAQAIADRIRVTPVLTVDPSDFDPNAVAGRSPDGGLVSLKLEYLQHSGTFKARGAMHFMLANPISAAGVTAASGGNHGAAVAWAAQQLGHRASIFVPTISAPAKVARLRSYGAEVVQVGDVYADALEACLAHQARTGATAIHAYEAPDVFAGAGTTGREFDLQMADAGLPPLDSVLVACGGGGLVGGIASWFAPGTQTAGTTGTGGTTKNTKTTNNTKTTIVACETFGTACYAEALKAGRPVDVVVQGVTADALGASSVGSLAFDALSAAGAESVLVSDEVVMAARRQLWERYRIVVEPSAAVPIGAVHSGAWKPEPGHHTGIVICGANTSVADLDEPGGADR